MSHLKAKWRKKYQIELEEYDEILKQSANYRNRQNAIITEIMCTKHKIERFLT